MEQQQITNWLGSILYVLIPIVAAWAIKKELNKYEKIKEEKEQLKDNENKRIWSDMNDSMKQVVSEIKGLRGDMSEHDKAIAVIVTRLDNVEGDVQELKAKHA